MRFIDKKSHEALKYQSWLKRTSGKEHPKYNSSSFIHYYSIIYDLLICQNGLCAYTEKFLASVEQLQDVKWSKNNCMPFKFAGQLDHYDPTLKTKYGWLWDNFFVVDTDVNIKNKRQIIPKGILKPDKNDFDAFSVLDYDIKEHIFIPKIILKQAEKDNILHDLFALGINFEPIVQLRKKYLNPYLQKLNYHQQSLTEIQSELFQFHTAFLMAANKIK